MSGRKGRAKFGREGGVFLGVDRIASQLCSSGTRPRMAPACQCLAMARLSISRTARSLPTHLSPPRTPQRSSTQHRRFPSYNPQRQRPTARPNTPHDITKYRQLASYAQSPKGPPVDTVHTKNCKQNSTLCHYTAFRRPLSPSTQTPPTLTTQQSNHPNTTARWISSLVAFRRLLFQMSPVHLRYPASILAQRSSFSLRSTTILMFLIPRTPVSKQRPT